LACRKNAAKLLVQIIGEDVLDRVSKARKHILTVEHITKVQGVWPVIARMPHVDVLFCRPH
jgi:hypothetical protein